MAPIKTQGDFQYTIERQTAWGTAKDTAPIGLPGTIDFSFERDEVVIERYRGLRTANALDSLITNGLKIPTAKMSIPATAQLLNVMLPAIFQKDADWTAVANVFTLYPVAYADLPLCKSTNGTTEGYVFTLTERNPAASLSKQLKNCVPTNIKLSISPTAHDGLLWMDIDWIGQGYSETANPSGTITQAPLTNPYRFNEYDLFGFTSTDCTGELVSWEANFSYGAKYVADLYNGEVAFPKFSATGSFQMVGGANAETLRTYAMSTAVGTSYLLKLQFGDGTVSAAGELNFENYVQFVGDPAIEKAEGELVTLNWKGVEDAAGEYPAKVVYFYQAA